MSDVTKYMGMVVNSNPEMIVLGITGKRYLSNFNDDEEIYRIYQKGDIDFIKNIVKNRQNKQAIALPNAFLFSNRILIILTMIYIGWSLLGFIFGEKLYNHVFYIFPLVIFVAWLFKNLLSYKIYQNVKSFLISSGIVAILAVAYMLIVL